MLREFGTWRLADVLELAIGYAENGYPVVPRISAAISQVQDLFREEWTTSADVYLRDGVPVPGRPFRNRDLAATYRRILDESRGGLVPPRIQPHQPRISQEFESAHDTGRRQELQCRDDAQSQTFITRMNRKLRLIGLDRIVHQHVEHDLIPKDIRGVG